VVPLGCCCEKRDGSFFGALPRTPSTLSCSLQERWSPRRAPRGNLFTLRSVCFRGVGETCPAGNHHNYFRTSNSHRALSFSLGRRAKISEGVLPTCCHLNSACTTQVPAEPSYQDAVCQFRFSEYASRAFSMAEKHPAVLLLPLCQRITRSSLLMTNSLPYKSGFALKSSNRIG